MAREWLAFCGDSRLGLKGRDVHDVWGDALLSQLSKLEIFSSFLGHEIGRTRRLLLSDVVSLLPNVSATQRSIIQSGTHYLVVECVCVVEIFSHERRNGP
jgi:hypothetical protein